MKQIFVVPQQKSFKWQPNKSQYLAVATKDVLIYDKSKTVVSTVPLLGDFHCFDWSLDGQYLAIICKNSSIVVLWNSRGTVSQVETGMKYLECVFWSSSTVYLS